jgi:anaerobic magnesium-protoporphyrin IX monomethyl ester cyclase
MNQPEKILIPTPIFNKPTMSVVGKKRDAVESAAISIPLGLVGQNKSEIKVLFVGMVNSGSRPGKAGLFLPLGLAYLSAAIKNHGYQCDCIDLHTEEIMNTSKTGDLWDHLDHFDYSSYSLVAFGGVFLRAKELQYVSQKIRERNPGLFQIVGGQIATIISDLILETTSVDCVGLYEGEETLVELVQVIESGLDWREVKGLKFRDDNGKPVESPSRPKLTADKVPPIPDRESWGFDLIRKAFPVGSPGRYNAVAFASRGCPFTCTFCNPLSGKEIRTREIDDIILELKHLKEEWNVQYVRFFDEVFIGSKDRIRTLCNKMIEEKLHIFWWCQTQVRLMDEDLIILMKKAGCINISYGIESGSALILDEMKKGITPEVARQAVEWTHKHGISPGCSMIAGFPSETKKTIEESRDFLISLNHVQWESVPEIDYVVPLPDTELFHKSVEMGFITNPQEYIVDLMGDLGRHTQSINLTKMSEEEMKETIDRCNWEVRRDFYSKHPLRYILYLLRADHLRIDLIFRHFSLKQLIPFLESVAWVAVGKHMYRFKGKFDWFNFTGVKKWLRPLKSFS